MLSLLEWRRAVADSYAAVRAARDPEAAWHVWRAQRDELFRAHAQSPIPPAERASFSRLPYFAYDPGARALAEVTPATPEHFELPTSGDGVMGFTRFAVATFELGGARCELPVFWLDGYAGGVFVPFRDATCGRETYGGGRYLLDTAKGADLGAVGDRLLFDFNFAYNPSCSYDPRWTCPLPPPGSTLTTDVRAGERFRRKG